jgi:hypothetical protein
MTNPRRNFLVSGAAIAAGMTLGTQAFAQAKLADDDPQATALGYVSDTTKANQAKYPAHAATQMCSNCALFGGKATDATGPCPIYGGKLVAAKGWCSAYAKKAA